MTAWSGSKRVLTHPYRQEDAVPVPIVCLDARVRQWMETFRPCPSKPKYQHFVIVLAGLLLGQETRTLSGVLRGVAGGPSLVSVSRFLARPMAPGRPGADLAEPLSDTDEPDTPLGRQFAGRDLSGGEW